MGNQYKQHQQRNDGGLGKIEFIDPEFAPQVTNAVLAGHTQFEFVVQFLFINGINNTGYDLGSFVMNPIAFKKFAEHFQEQLSRYEHAFGKIDTKEQRIVVPGEEKKIEIPT